MAKQTYQVQAGDTWMSLAAQYKTSLASLLNLNKGVNAISTGQGVYVPAPPATASPTGGGGKPMYSPVPNKTPGSGEGGPKSNLYPPTTGHPGGSPAPAIPPTHTDTYDPAGTSGGRRYVSPSATPSTTDRVTSLNQSISNGELPPGMTLEEFNQLPPETQQWLLAKNMYVTDETGNMALRTTGDVNNGGILASGAMGTLAWWSSGTDGYGYGINYDGRPLDSSGNPIGARRSANGSIIRNGAQNRRRAEIAQKERKESNQDKTGGESSGLVNYSWRV